MIPLPRPGVRHENAARERFGAFLGVCGGSSRCGLAGFEAQTINWLKNIQVSEMDKKDSQKKMCDCNQGRLLCSCKVPPAVAEYAVQKLAALKAQPSGVMPELRELLEMLLIDDERRIKHAGSWRQDLHERATAMLARLNSSPVSAGDDAEQAAFEAWLVRVCPSGDADSVHAQWLESSDYEDFCDQAYDAEAERLTAEALGVGAGINPNATSIDDIFLTESAGGVDERAAFDQIHACCSASAATSTFAGNRVPDPQARAATPSAGSQEQGE